MCSFSPSQDSSQQMDAGLDKTGTPLFNSVAVKKPVSLGEYRKHSSGKVKDGCTLSPQHFISKLLFQQTHCSEMSWKKCIVRLDDQP